MRRAGMGTPRSGAVVDLAKFPKPGPDGAVRLRLGIAVSRRLKKSPHDCVFLSKDGIMIGPPRTWRPSEKNDRFRRASARTGPLPCTQCAGPCHLDPRRHGLRMAFRCYWCLRIYCFGCARRHFGRPKRGRRKAFGRNCEVVWRAKRRRR